tara:strand:+ start:1967 stop:2626 length:660 start_codon:yes stop_codon:yes gene_type:complete
MKKIIIFLVRFFFIFLRKKIAIIDIGCNENIFKNFFYLYLRRDEFKLINEKKNFSINDYDEKINFYFGLFTYNKDISNIIFIMLIEDPEIYHKLMFDKVIKKKTRGDIKMDIFEKSFNDNLITRFIIDKYPNRNLGINEEITESHLNKDDYILAEKNLKNNNLKIFTRDSFVIKLLYFLCNKKRITEKSLRNQISEMKIELKDKMFSLDKKIYQKIKND